MRPAVKKIIVASIVLLIAVFTTNAFLSHHIYKKLTQQKEWQLKVNDVSVNILTRSVELHQLRFNSGNNAKDSLVLKVKNVVLTGVSPITFFGTKKLKIGSITFLSPDISIYKRSKTNTKKPSKPTKNTIREIIIDECELKALKIKIFDAEEITILKAPKIDFKIADILWNKNDKKNIPISYTNVLLKADSIYYRSNKTEELYINTLNIDHKNMAFEGLSMKTKYEKDKLQNNIKTQRDWVDLEIPKIEILDYVLEELDNNLSFSAKKLKVHEPNLELYRFKGLPENTKSSPLYSKVLRDLPFYLNIDATYIKNGFLDYSEKLDFGKPSGSINFSKFESTIVNLHNHSTRGDTTNISINAHFMKEAPLKLDWGFQVNNLDDVFMIQGNMKNLNISKTNTYMEPVLNVKSQGNINALYFTLTGNNYEALGDVKMEYKNLKISVLDSEKGTIRKFLTKAANLIIKTNSPKTDAKEKQVRVERDPSKSFFNYFWKCIQKGTLESAI